MNAAVKAAAAEHGLWYPPDPSSFEICSIGGNVATNAGGLCCVKYGVTTDYVLGMTVVLADGTAVELGGPRLKDVAGLSLTKLFVGSEGTLGVIITEVVLRLRPGPAAAGHPGRDLRHPRRRHRDRPRHHPAAAALDAGVHGPADDQRGRGPDQDGPGPLRRGDAGHPVRRAGRPRGRRAASRSPGSARSTAPPRSSPPTTPTRGSSSWSPAGWRSRRSSGPAPCCSRTSACRCPQLGALVDGIASDLGRAGGDDRGRSRTPATATPTR